MDDALANRDLPHFPVAWRPPHSTGDVLHRAWSAVRSALTPANVALAVAVGTAWLALLAWTGMGFDGWRSRPCERLDPHTRLCLGVRSGKDESRIVPYTVGARFPS